jgi:hypothetical protein
VKKGKKVEKRKIHRKKDELSIVPPYPREKIRKKNEIKNERRISPHMKILELSFEFVNFVLTSFFSYFL